MFSFLSRNFIFITVGVILLVVAWYLFGGSKPKGGELVTTTVISEENSVEGNIVDTLLTLRAVSLSGTIFSDPAFSSLNDFGTQIVPEPVGRPNPFAPRGLSTTTRETSTTTKSSLR